MRTYLPPGWSVHQPQRILKHDMHEELAIRLLGWKWVSFVGIPVRGTDGYPTPCRVRQLFSKEQIERETFKTWLRDNQGANASGLEPLSYAYCSSSGPTPLPKFTILVSA